jgi:hypothetical protein
MNSPAWSGQFVVIDWPFTDRSSSKRRPALVVGEPDAHGDLRVLKVTSRRPTESALVVTPDDLEEGQPKTTSYLRLGHSLKIHQSRLRPLCWCNSQATGSGWLCKGWAGPPRA